ncbi:MAG: YnbE family lipoprotein [Pseudomonadota bacterium]|nr:YnbE family lipoprotein [Pseudomonadota bacterium]
MKYRYQLLSLVMIGVVLGGCAPTVKVEAPDKPITINLNVKIEHEIRIKVDRELDQLISQEKGLF